LNNDITEQQQAGVELDPRFFLTFAWVFFNALGNSINFGLSFKKEMSTIQPALLLPNYYF